MTDIYYAGAEKHPTNRQKSLYKHLAATCLRNGLRADTGMRLKYMHDYWSAIEILKKRLKDAGVKWGKELDHGE